jgi:hypothetical protein
MFANCAAITHIRTFPIGMDWAGSDGVKGDPRDGCGEYAALIAFGAADSL